MKTTVNFFSTVTFKPLLFSINLILCIFYFIASILGAIKNITRPRSESFISAFSSNLVVSGFTFYSFIHFSYFLQSALSYWSCFILIRVNIPGPINEKTIIFFPKCILNFPVKYQLTIYSWIHFCALDSVTLIYFSVLY